MNGVISMCRMYFVNLLNVEIKLKARKQVWSILVKIRLKQMRKLLHLHVRHYRILDFMTCKCNNFRICFRDRKSTRLNSSHVAISYAVFCLKTKTQNEHT